MLSLLKKETPEKGAASGGALPSLPKESKSMSSSRPLPPRKPLEHLSSIRELGREGRVLGPETPIMRHIPDSQTKYAVWCVKGDEMTAGRRPVWLIVSEEFMGSTMYHQVRAQLRSQNFEIESQRVTTPQLLQAIHEGVVFGHEDGAPIDNELIDFYNSMVAYALHNSVSDIHLEIRKNSASIRMRKHGRIIPWKEISHVYARSLATVIHNVLADSEKQVVFNEKKYQPASVNTRVRGVDVKLRFQSLPVYPDGQDVVLRVLPIGDDDEAPKDLCALGYTKNQMQQLIDIIKKPVGSLIIAGTTGSGKSTTLKNLLMYINAQRQWQCKIYTVEDPPEYKIPGVSQIPVVRALEDANNPNASNAFGAPLTATMRADPDILMIGEIRDDLTANGMQKATQSGHQVLTTIHASSALGTVSRLLDFKVTPSVMGSPEFLNGMVYQKLVPVLCANCSTLFTEQLSQGEVDEELLGVAKRLSRAIGEENLGNVRLAKRGGCDKCNHTGITGRSVCAEIVVPDFTMMKYFREQKDIEAYKYWRRKSDGNPLSDNMTGKTVLEHALTKVAMGIVSPLDVEELFGPADLSRTRMEELEAEEAMVAAEAAVWKPGKAT